MPQWCYALALQLALDACKPPHARCALLAALGLVGNQRNVGAFAQGW